MKIVVWFSCGAASAVAAKLTIDQFGADNVHVVNTPIAEEDPDNRRFLADVEKWLGINVEIAVHPDFPNSSAVEVWDKEKAMSFPHGAPCTRTLKKGARYHWEISNKFDYLVMGFTAEERDRHEKFKLSERENILPILIDAGLSKAGSAAVIQQAGIALPISYEQGYPNANCTGCSKATSPTYWNHVRRTHPVVFAARSEQSRRLGVRLARYKGRRIFLDELPSDAIGRPMKSLQMPECGLFCEEPMLPIRDQQAKPAGEVQP
ncbi:hypothetical protein M0D44_19810 [Xanthomonas prunicola]|uniref:hypothetical protein n=1 Tax=Xanthomonas prunicola TaxID=2053930 RepID=UPI0021B225F6|nr:hypothetical protein [Xanthomonas prunicola]UXA48490.1 hypothetical protein M0D44_19810 [Xanthomonas prunicola]